MNSDLKLGMSRPGGWGDYSRPGTSMSKGPEVGNYSDEEHVGSSPVLPGVISRGESRNCHQGLTDPLGVLGRRDSIFFCCVA